MNTTEHDNTPNNNPNIPKGEIGVRSRFKPYGGKFPAQYTCKENL